MRHDIAKSLQPVINVHSSLYANVNGFLNRSIITAENGPDLLSLIQSKCLYVPELTAGFDSNLNNNAVRKKDKYLNPIQKLSRNCRCLKFSPTNAARSYTWWMTFWHWQKWATLYNQKIANLAIRSRYIIFCCRNRNWDSPDLMNAILNFFLYF